MKKIALLYGTFHTNEIAQMKAAAINEAAKNDLMLIADVPVPGVFEMPLALKKLLMRDDIDGVIVLGIIERGETKHGLVMGQTVTQALIQLQLEYDKPLGMGILGPEILPEQIPPRLDSYARAAVKALVVVL